jgi:hypothetical protein
MRYWDLTRLTPAEREFVADNIERVNLNSSVGAV